MNISVILSGGVGGRFGAKLPKQYQPLLGQEVVGHVVAALQGSIMTDKIVIIAAKPYLQQLQNAYGVDCIIAGKTHNESVKNGLDYIASQYTACTNVLFVDAVRPFVTAKVIDKYYGYLNEHDAVITAQYITDSLGKKGNPFVDRTDYYLIQKPEAFKFKLIYRYFRAESEMTAIVQQLPVGFDVHYYFGMKQNLKITYPEDLCYAEHLKAIYSGVGGMET